MEMEKIFQKMMILLIVFGFNGVFGSESPLLVTSFLKEKENELFKLKDLFKRYDLDLNGYFKAQDTRSCVTLYINSISKSLANNEFFIDPKTVKNDFCKTFLTYVQSRPCNGILDDFQFFLGNDFLNRIYTAEANDKPIDLQNKNKLQKFVENIFALFFLFPQGNTCACQYQSCPVRNDLNLYKAYGALRMCMFNYKNYVFSLRSRGQEETPELNKLVKKNIDDLNIFVNNVLIPEDKNLLRKQIDVLSAELFNSGSLSEIEVNAIKNKLKKNIFSSKPKKQIEQPVYQQYFQKFKGFFTRGSKQSE